MVIPAYQSAMMPLMQYASDGQVHSFAEACDHLAKHFGLGEDALRELLPSGRYPVFRSRGGWATTYLTKAGLLERPSRGRFRLTARGREALHRSATIDTTFLRNSPEFVALQDGTDAETAQDAPTPQLLAPETPPPIREERSPDELLEYAYLELRKALGISFAIFHSCGVFHPRKVPRQPQLQEDESSAKTDSLAEGHCRGHLCALPIGNPCDEPVARSLSRSGGAHLHLSGLWLGCGH